MKWFGKHRDDDSDLQNALLLRRYPMPQEKPAPTKWSQTAQSVFNRTLADSTGTIIPDALYNIVIGLVLCWGFLVNWLIVHFVPHSALVSINIWVVLVGYFASCFLGVYLFTSSEKPIVSFIGYNFVVVPFGAVVNFVVYYYDPALVIQAIKITGIVTGSMMVLGTLFPLLFQRIAAALAISLVLVILWELFDIFVLGIHHGIIDWIVVVIFCGYVGVDWGRANQIPKTVDNAVDSAAALYMDIINLFLRIVRILGRRK
jgi:FtsH-binding integral membrane protein